MRFAGRALVPQLLGLFLVAAAISGCDLTKLTANTTVDVFAEAAPAFDQHWDYEFAGQAAPGSIIQLEGVWRITPDNEVLLLQLAKSYTGYAYGWVEDDLEQVDPMDFQREEHLRQRARLMYIRARNFAFRAIRNEEDGFDAAREAGLESFEQWLDENFDDAEDAPILLWAGYSWGSAINVSRDDPMMIADLPFAKALVEHSVELDPTYYNAAGLTFMGVVTAEELGGDPENAKPLFERALDITDRRALIVQYNYAKSYAVRTQDRELFESLLNEVLEAGDVLPEARLANKIAKRRARRLLRQADDLFVE